jgi:hypothetical protein
MATKSVYGDRNCNFVTTGWYGWQQPLRVNGNMRRLPGTMEPAVVVMDEPETDPLEL